MQNNFSLKGKVIVVTGGTGILGNAFVNGIIQAEVVKLVYTLAKSSIDSYTQWFAVEQAKIYGDVIRMNSIDPGFLLTEQNISLLTNSDGSLTDRGNLVIK